MFLIKKTIRREGQTTQFVLMTNGHSEILEIVDKNEVYDLVEVMNENSDSNCSYEVINVKTNK